MVDLVLENGSGVPGANTYCSLEYSDDYFASHPFYSDAWEDLDTSQKKNLLAWATRAADAAGTWPGTPSTAAQGLLWPRSGVVTRSGLTLPSNAVPEDLRRAVCELAYFYSTPGANPDAPDESAGLESLKVDVIELRFSGSVARQAVPQAAARLLAGLQNPYFNPRVRRVQVGLS